MIFLIYWFYYNYRIIFFYLLEFKIKLEYLRFFIVQDIFYLVVEEVMRN